MHLTAQEQQQINRLVAEVEAASGAQLVIAVIGKADSYPEIPWKAFALGVAAAGSLLAMAAFLGFYELPAHAAVFASMILLGCGLACAATTIFVPAFARAYLDRLRAEVEVGQYARAMFIDRAMSETPAHIGVLILMSLFERQVAIVPDTGVREHLSDAHLDAVRAKMIPLLAGGRIAAAAEMALTMIGELLEGKLDRSAGGNALPTSLVQERGS
jgi:putative membrane protein